MNGQDSENDKALFMRALEKKRDTNKLMGEPKLKDVQARKRKSPGNTQKIFRRKSGSS